MFFSQWFSNVITNILQTQVNTQKMCPQKTDTGTNLAKSLYLDPGQLSECHILCIILIGV